jgi:hypothetical protein
MSYLRKYQILVVNEENKAIDVSNLRCTFKIEKLGYQAINFGEISIYNLTGNTESAIIREGMRVIVNAGYEDGTYGKIFDGDIFQPLRDRENVVDYKLTLHCIDGDSLLNNKIVKFTVNSGINQRGMIDQIVSQAYTPAQIGTVTDLDSKTLPRGKVFFGEPKKYFRLIAQDNNAQFYANDGQIHISKITDTAANEAIVYSPQNGIIGTPTQIDYGVSFKVLLDSRIKISNPPMLVKIDNAYIRQQKLIYGQLPTLLDQDGVYKVSKVTHTGDTRGQEWYTEITGVSSPGKIPLMLDTVNMSPN